MAKKKSTGSTPAIGTCKSVRNSRTGKCMQLCFVGKAKSRSGWSFKKGTSRACAA